MRVAVKIWIKRIAIGFFLLTVYAIVSAGAGVIAGFIVAGGIYGIWFSKEAQERRAMKAVEKRIVKLV
jgi:hypothetical protein